MKIEPYTHRCTVQYGPAAGNKNHHEVSPYEVEYAEVCEFCGYVLGTPEQVLAHIYAQLSEDD